ncbi:MAG: glycoside hydrolase family 13 protein [Treponema sp.]|jgi:glycosidase|nr:glycoside hydrolase family 13 protein [Treponema sp.]
MSSYFTKIEHHSAPPWRYFDVQRQKIIIRAVSTTDLVDMELLYNDPFAYEKAGDEWLWRYKTARFCKQFCGDSALMWRVEIDVPSQRRLKYGFRASFDNNEICWFSEWGLEPFSDERVNNPHNHFFYPFIHAVDAPKTPQWVENTVWYQIFPDRFYRSGTSILPTTLADWEKDKPTSNSFFGGDIEGIRLKLGYLKDLGVNGIYLTPIFTSPSNHKYNTEDYFNIDEHFGGTSALKALVADAHDLGIRVMLDAVFNHIGSSHPFWQDVIARQEKSPYKDFFHIHSFPVKERVGESIGYDCFAFTPHMPKWNTENPQARKYLLDAALYWIKECDIDAWRLDVANEVSFDFWREFSTLVHKTKPDFYVVGEVWDDASEWVNRGFFDAAMNYPLGYAVSAFFLKNNIDAQTFADTLFRALSRYDDSHNRIAFNLLDSHDTERALTTAHGNKQALRNAFTVLFLLPGSPCIYYGDEIGMGGSGDPHCRAPMIWDEALQDKGLLTFFQRLVKFRLANISIINNSVLSFTEDEGIFCLRLTPLTPTRGLTVVYTGERAEQVEDLEHRFGPFVFSALDDEANKSSIPLDSIAVFKQPKAV